jgi:hypothetical protein
MGRLGGCYVGLELLPGSRPNRQLIRTAWVMGQTIFGKALLLNGGYERPAVPAHREFGKRWFEEVQELWDRSAIRPHPIRARAEGGLESVLGGIELLRRGEVAGEKLVYMLD